MAKRRREKVSEDTVQEQEFYTAFIDTSLGTHLAMMISSADTVSDLKKKIVLEHSQLFPRIGEIKVLSLQVKRQGHFYHLPDSMLVFSAYEGSKRHKFLFVDASSLEEHNREQRSYEPDNIGHVPLLYLENRPQFNKHNLLSDDPSKQVPFVDGSAGAKIPNAVQVSPWNFHGEISKAVQMGVSHIDGDCQNDLDSDITRKLPNRVSRDSSHNNVEHIQLENLDELSPESELAAKKRKTEHNENGVNNSLHMKRSSSDHEIVNIETAVADAGKSIPSATEIRQKELNKDFYKTSSSDINKIAKSGEPNASQSEPTAETSHNLESVEHVGDNSDSSNWKKVTKPANCTTDRQENIFGSNVTSEQLKDDQMVTGPGSKKGKKKRKRTSSMPSDQAAIPDSTPIQHIEEKQKFKGNLEIGCKVLDNLSDSVIVPGQSIQSETFSRPSLLTQKGTHSNLIDEGSDENIHLGRVDSEALQTDRRGHKEIALNHDQVMPSEKCKPSDEGDVDGTNKASILMHKLIATSEPMETVTPDGTKRTKKKRAKRKASSMQTDSVIEQTNMAAASSSVPNLNAEDHISEKTDKNESMLPPAEIDQSNKVEEGRGLSCNLDPQGKASECFKLAGSGEAELTTREEVHSSDLLGSNEATDVGNSTGKKRKKRKTNNSAAKVQSISELEHNLGTVSDISLSVQDIAVSNLMSDYNRNESKVPCVGIDQAAAVWGDKGLSMEQQTEPTGSKPLHFGETNCNINDSATTPMLSEAKDVKSGSQRKKRSTAKSSVINQDGSEMELVNTLNDLSALTDSPANNAANETKNTPSTLSQSMWRDASKDKLMNASASAAHKEGVKISHNEAVILPSTEIDQSQEDRGDMGENGREVLKNNRSSIDDGIYYLPVEGETNEVQGQQLNESGGLKENDCNVDKKANKKKKKKKNPIAAAEVLSSSEINEQKIVTEELAASGDKTTGVDIPPSNATKTSGLAKRRTVIQSTTSDLKLEKNAGTESKFSNPEHAPKDANPSEVPFKESPETEIDNGNNIGTAKGEDEGINFRHYFVAGHHQDEIASSVKQSRSMKPKRKKEKHNVVAENKLESSGNRGNQNKSDGRNINDNQVEECASRDEHNKVLLQDNKKTPKASEDGVRAPSSHKVGGDKTLERVIKPAVADDGTGAIRTAPALLEEKNGSLTASNPISSSKVSKRVAENTTKTKQQSRFNSNNISNRSSSSKSAGDVLNSSGRQKSLLTTKLALFREDSSESSSDENKILISDASTRTPSASSSSSGDSVGKTALSQDTKRNGSVNASRKSGGAGNILNPMFSGPQQMSMDMVLKSSSRFKKAKLAASQSQAEDSESQPVDFVPDTQPNQ